MKKRATLNGVQNNGSYSNPVAVLYNEVITYKITAINANSATGSSMTITDTLPAYMDYNSGSGIPTPVSTTAATTPPRTVLTWTLSGLTPYSTQTAEFKAQTQSGSVASQPLFVNSAWVTVSDTILVPTDSSTYHQGAGVAAVIFSSGAGGFIFNSDVQAVDYRSTPRSGVIVVPDDGYKFVGWSHDAYVSLRGIEIPASDGIMHYDTLTIYGNVELHAVFAPTSTATNSTEVENLRSDVPSIWASDSYLYVRIEEEPIASKTYILRVYTPEGVLIKQQTILTKGIFKTRLPRGIYIATLNNGVGTKVLIE
jgi:uncharacterized repeat protein (TIGR01451 family)